MRLLPLAILLLATTAAAQVAPLHLSPADLPDATEPAHPPTAIGTPRSDTHRSRAIRTPPTPRLAGGRAVLTVNSAYDEPDENDSDGICSTSFGECTLRAAMEQAEALAPAPVTIAFDLAIGPEGSYDPSTGAWRIAPNLNAGAGTYGSLPFLRRSDLIIDGLTQTGATCGDLLEGIPHDLRVIVDGRYLLYPEDGFDFGYADAIQIVGLVIQNVPGAAIQGTFTNSSIRCNYLGTTQDGHSAAPNIFGIDYTNAGMQPTGPLSIENNLISGNQNHGVILREHRGAVLRNLIGTTASGDAPLPNGFDGVVNFGRDAEIDANVISANGMHGIRIGAPGPDFIPTNNRITNNWIGLSRLGTRNGLGNGSAGIVAIEGPSPETVVTDLFIGGPGDPNTIGDNGHLAGPGEPAGGISLRGGNRVSISGNVIGLDASGAAVPNLVGIEIDGQSGALLRDVTVGGLAEGAGNVIAANTTDGLFVRGPATILGNRIGLDADGAARGNGTNGVRTDAAVGLTIEANEIGANGGAGVFVVRGAETRVRANWIGVTASGESRGNGGDGIYLEETTDALIGGTLESDGNTVAHNGAANPFADGVFLVDVTRAAILGNAVFENAALGIDHCPGPFPTGCDDVTPNDDPEADGVPNAPVLVSALATGADTDLSFDFVGEPSARYRVEFFVSPTADPSGYGEGVRFVTHREFRTNGSGRKSLTIRRDAADFPVGDWVTATATRLDDGAIFGFATTSEFSNAAQVTGTASGSGVTVTATPTRPASPVLIPQGGRLDYDLTFTVAPDGPASFQYWTRALRPSGAMTNTLLGPRSLSLAPGTSTTLSFRQRVPGSAATGTYEYIAYVGTHPSAEVDSDRFPVEVTSGSGAGSTDWHVEEVAPDAKTEASWRVAPNPVRTHASIHLPTAGDEPIHLVLLDALGREIARLADRASGPVELRPRDLGLSPGVYTLRLTTSTAVSTYSLTVVR